MSETGIGDPFSSGSLGDAGTSAAPLDPVGNARKAIELAPADIGRLLSNLSPTGDLWSIEPDTVRQQALRALGGTFSRLQSRANALLVDIFPKTSVELLPEWEASVGLPDPCSGPDATIGQRQAHVVARLTETDGPSIPSLIAFAKALGYTITIEEFAPARVGILTAGSPLYGEAWAYAWQVHAPAITIEYFTAGASSAGDPLESTGNLVLVCELQRLSPAHTVLFFGFGS